MLKILRNLPILHPARIQPFHIYHIRSPILRRSIITQSGQVNVQHVRLEHRPKKSDYIFQWVQLFSIAGLLYFQLSILAGDDSETEQSSKGQAKKKDKQGEAGNDDGDEAAERDEQDDEDTIFIPLGFAYELPRKFYKGSDPEWQSFVQLSKDKRQCLYLKNQLAGLVGQFLGTARPFEKLLGKGNKPGKYWLDIDFPDGPPPEYERRGIEITEDHIAWTTQKVHPLHYQRLQKALWPKPIASSIWASYRTMVSLQYAKFKNYLSLESKSEGSNGGQSNAAEINLSKIHKKMTPEKPESASKAHSDQPESPAAASSGKARSRSSMGDWSSDLVRVLPSSSSVSGVDGDIASSVEAFRKTFAKTWRPAQTPPERGTVMFSGIVELSGPKGVATLEILAAYHVAEGRWTQIVYKYYAANHVLIKTVLPGLRFIQLQDKMPRLGVTALPGLNMGFHDLNDLDFSPTQTPAQTRSVSPVRGQHMPHSYNEAADFVTKLNTIVETEGTSDASKASIVQIKNASESAPVIAYAPIPALIKLDTDASSFESKEKKSVVVSPPFTPIKSAMEGYTKVNALDGSASTSAASKIQILLVYFAFNLGLTLYNKAVMIKVRTPLLPLKRTRIAKTVLSSRLPSF
ncbi:MAG: hypothetical protein Q9212_003976 [Teloschistes hypoglaucus]